jgi:hypothetical protein
VQDEALWFPAIKIDTKRFSSMPDLPPRVWLSNFDSDHIELKMIYWDHPSDYWKYTAHEDQRIRLIWGALETNGIQLADPACTTRVEDSLGGTVIPPQNLA